MFLMIRPSVCVANPLSVANDKKWVHIGQNKSGQVRLLTNGLSEERLTLQSGLEFVIARPMRLTNGEAKGTYARTAELVRVPSPIARGDVADFMIEACESSKWVGKAVHFGGP